MKWASVRLYKMCVCVCVCVCLWENIAKLCLFNSIWSDHWIVFILERWYNEGKKHSREGEKNRKKPLKIGRAISDSSLLIHRDIMSWPITNRTLWVTSDLWLPWTWEAGHHLQNKVLQILVDPRWPPQHIPLSLVCCTGMNRGTLIYHLKRKPALSLHATKSNTHSTRPAVCNKSQLINTPYYRS